MRSLPPDNGTENLRIDDLIAHAGVGNLIGAGIGFFPEGFLKQVAFMDVVRLHNKSNSSSRIRRLTREELLSRDRIFFVWESLYVRDAKPKTLLQKMSAIKMLEKSSDDREDAIAYKAIEHLAPEMLEQAAEKVVGRANDPHALRNLIADTKRYPLINLKARMKLFKMFTL